MSAIIQLNDDVFPENMIHLRKKRRLSQSALARQAGISVHFLRGIERGRFRSQFIYEEYQRLCSVLGISPEAMGTLPLHEIGDSNAFWQKAEVKRNDP